ncbi:MAG TPA: DUF523 domain-containing protein [Stenomitos sp.]
MMLVSACLVGERCRYDGDGFDRYPDLKRLVVEGEAIAVCPEELGGLPTPRPPAELQGGDGAAAWRGEARLTTHAGADVTEAFLRGAEETARLAAECGATLAVLKARSPSCGCHGIYDGSFSGQIVPGMGVTAARLKAMGLQVESEETWR